MNANKIRRIIAVFLLVVVFTTISSGCAASSTDNTETSKSDVHPITSFRDIPGITEAEIRSVEALQEKYEYLIFGMTPTTEMFIDVHDGELNGYSVLFCRWLTELLGIEFRPMQYEWGNLIEGLAEHKIDFTGELTATEERRNPTDPDKMPYFMTDPIAIRTIKGFHLEGRESLKEISMSRPVRYIFFEGTSTIDDVTEHLQGEYEIITVNDFDTAYQKLKSGEGDQFFDESCAESAFDEFGNVVAVDFLPLIYSPVSLSTQNPELEVIISVVQGALHGDTIRYLTKMYKTGYSEYHKHKMTMKLNAEERRFIEDNPVIPFAVEYDNYPISFYNEQEGEWQGILFDVLEKVEELTGLTFEIANSTNAGWTELLGMLDSGDVSFISELIRTPEREGRYLWPDTSLITDNYALISKTETPNISANEILHARVGVARNTAYEEVFKSWFPDHRNTVLSDGTDDSFADMADGNIDFVMASMYKLLYLTNYAEKPGFKANIIFDYYIESTLGLNINETTLHSIFNKALAMVDTQGISDQWTRKTFDYRIRIAEARQPLVIGGTVFAMLLLFFCIFAYASRNKNKRINKIAHWYKSILDAAPTPISVTDANMNWTFVNKAVGDLLGMNSEDMIGKPCSTWNTSICNTDDCGIACAKRGLRRSHFVQNGHSHQVDVEIFKNLDGEIAGFIEIVQDITELKEMHLKQMELEKANRAKSEFLAKMSHEMRTPMNAIIGMAELALREKTPGAIHEHIVTVKQAGANLLSIINDILDFSKIESGTLEIKPSIYHFSSLLNDVISIIRMRALDKQIRFSVNIDCGIPNAMIGDEVRIRQVLINILGNAVKYTEKGFVAFSVYEESRDDDTIGLIMEIADTGRGIKPEDMDKLFGEYVQVDMDKNQGIEGVGLGLAISQRIINQMGGSINAQSMYREGSRFTISLPQKIHDREKLASVNNPENIRVILYERRELYAHSIAFTIDNLGVYCTFAETDEDLEEQLSGDEFSHVFIAYGLYKRNEREIKRLAANAKIVMLAEFGEMIPDKDMSILAMPAHSLHIARILNGKFENFSYSETDEITARFIAPDARILIVDDISANLVVAKGLLAPYQMKIDQCKSGEEAIKAAGSERYDLIFMDHRMPGMDGVEATKLIRDMGGDDPYFLKLPIVALTANAISGTKEMFLDNGLNDFMSKPIDTVKLNAILEKWLPKDKQKNPASDKTMLARAGEKSMMTDSGIIEIEGVDVKKGVAISGGMISLYLDILTAFYNDGQERIGIIRNCLESGNLTLYRTHVHGIKSALFNIGAITLSETAKALELAVGCDDMNYVHSHNAVFLSDLESLLGRVNSFLTKQKGIGTAAGIPDPGKFKTELIRLSEALSSMERNEINKALNTLQESAPTEEYAESVKDIANKIILADYDEAEALVGLLLNSA